MSSNNRVIIRLERYDVVPHGKLFVAFIILKAYCRSIYWTLFRNDPIVKCRETYMSITCPMCGAKHNGIIVFYDDGNVYIHCSTCGGGNSLRSDRKYEGLDETSLSIKIKPRISKQKSAKKKTA
jgi:ribosomal protein S27E